MANLRFAVAMQRLVPYLGYHHVIMFLQIVGVILVSVLLAGCSSYSAMTNVYLFSLAYTNTTRANLSPIEKNISDTFAAIKGSSQLEVRVGYFGMCIRQRGVVWLCSSDAAGLAEQVGTENDPLNLIGAMDQFRNDVLFSGLLFMAIVISFISVCLLATFPGWHEERDERTGSDVDIRPFPSRPVSQAALACAFVAAILLLIASLWQHVGSVGAAAMADIANHGNVRTDIGTGAMSMAWIGFVVTALSTIMLVVLILSIVILDKLTDED